MTEPRFWRAQTLAARAARGALYPAAVLYGAGQSLRRQLTTPVEAGVPVICVGNATVGGTGKTPFCLLLQKLLAASGLAPTFLTRGYRGSMAGPVRVEARHRARATLGPEAEGAIVFQTTVKIEVPASARRVVAFCGIARPDRFFSALEENGCVVTARAQFPDHHFFTAADLQRLRARALKEGAVLITTEKDLMRLAPGDREGIVAARHAVAVDDPHALVRFVRDRIGH